MTMAAPAAKARATSAAAVETKYGEEKGRAVAGWTGVLGAVQRTSAAALMRMSKPPRPWLLRLSGGGQGRSSLGG